jgi:hypothetical protein
VPLNHPAPVVSRMICGDSAETQGAAIKSPYLPSVKRLCLAAAAVVTVAALLVVGTYGEAQRKAREDISECTPTAAEVADHREFARRLPGLLSDEMLAHPQFHRIVGVKNDGGVLWVEDCAAERRAARWGPWDAWNRMERLERVLGRDTD